MIRLHQLGKSVQVIIDKEWTRSCKVGLEFVMTLMATGIPVYHSRNMMHYKLLTISYEDSMFALGGSANMTKAAWSRIDEFIFHVEVPAAYQAPSTLQPVAGEVCSNDPKRPYFNEGFRVLAETDFAAGGKSDS
ncbi:hypothetical protein PC113_g5674 [Phytophthora cactorum]|uniref:Phospholipase D-like domain-containing protein n=1 Tax=Phytophthora cactorum TaxID=29920 RepID=A0A8T1ECD1_9STRA|nr:hypothetical protein PC113_g5674 [Phytophthora cactorum]KAG2949280.1 hypothetical protein PC117_g5362 [Phytophthora cactorum]